MYAKKILSFVVTCLFVSFPLNLFSTKDDSVSSKLLYGNLYGNSPWGNKVAQVEYKKKRIDASMDLLTKINAIKNELRPGLVQKERLRDEYAKQQDELMRMGRILESQRDSFGGDEREREKLERQIRINRATLSDLTRPDGDFFKLNAEINAITSELENDPEYKELVEARKGCLKTIMGALKEKEKDNDQFGVLIAKAIAGPNYNNVLDDIPVATKMEGALMGGTVLMVGALSEVVRDKAKNTIDRSVGTLWDYLIDIGPEGGEKGGYVVAKGTPEQVVQYKESITGKYLKKHMSV